MGGWVDGWINVPHAHGFKFSCKQQNREATVWHSLWIGLVLDANASSSSPRLRCEQEAENSRANAQSHAETKRGTDLAGAGSREAGLFVPPLLHNTAVLHVVLVVSRSISISAIVIIVVHNLHQRARARSSSPTILRAKDYHTPTHTH